MSIKADYEELGQLRVRCEQLETENEKLEKRVGKEMPQLKRLTTLIREARSAVNYSYESPRRRDEIIKFLDDALKVVQALKEVK